MINALKSHIVVELFKIARSRLGRIALFTTFIGVALPIILIGILGEKNMSTFPGVVPQLLLPSLTILIGIISLLLALSSWGDEYEYGTARVVLSRCLYSYDRPLTEAEIRWVSQSDERPQDGDLGVDVGCGWKEEVIYLDDPVLVAWLRDPSRQDHFVTFVSPVASRISAGLPLRCFAGVEWIHTWRWFREQYPDPSALIPDDCRGLIPISGRSILWTPDQLRAIPSLPVWHRLLINVCFYSALLWLAWNLIVHMQEAAQRRKGCCPKCRYDLRGDLDAGCPECGWGREKAQA